MSNYYVRRAAYWIDGNGAEIVLTLPAHWTVPDEILMAEAMEEAERMGLDLSYGRIEIGLWTDKGIEPETKALVPVRLIKLDGAKIFVKLPGAEWEQLNNDNADRLMGPHMTTHGSVDNGETWPLRFRR